MVIQECFLCSKKLPKRTHPETLEAAQLYSETIVKLLNFDNSFQIEEEVITNVKQEIPREVKVTFVTNSSAQAAAESNSCTIRKETRREAISNCVEGKLLEVSYCSACVQTVRRLNITFKQLERLQKQICEFKTKIVNQFILNCNDKRCENAADPGNNNYSLRNDILQDFQLKKWKGGFQEVEPNLKIAASPSSSKNPEIALPDRKTGTPQVKLTRLESLEELPEISRYFKKGSATGRGASVQTVKQEPIGDTSGFDLVGNCRVAIDDRGNVVPADIIGNCAVLGLESELWPEDHTNDGCDDDYNPNPLEFDSKYEPVMRNTNMAKLASDLTTRIKKPMTSHNSKRKKSRGTRNMIISISNENSTSSKFPCEFDGCDFESESESLTNLHINEVHKVLTKEYSCNKCGVDFYREESLQVHTRRHTYTHPCKDCDKGFSNRRTLRTHWNRDHKVDGVVLSCPSCSYKTKETHKMREHKLTHTSNKDFMCQHCGDSFKYSQRLRYHMGSKHPEVNPETESLYKCQQCDKVYANPAGLRNHTKTQHLKQYEMHCEICGQGVNSQSRLKSHMLKHTGELPQECNVCHAKFRFTSALNVHMRRHTGDFKHTCSVCSKNFTNGWALKRHALIHSGILKHFCPHCNKGFPVRNYLYIHLRSHESQEERAERKKKTKAMNPLQKLYNDLRKSNVTVASVALDPDAPQPDEAYPMIYDYSRSRQPPTDPTTLEEDSS